jgi:hypothetical protein
MKANTTIKASSQIDYSRGKCRSWIRNYKSQITRRIVYN